ncbi:ATP-binding protein [Actinomadura formosensis]|uniref:ATP-binding protein n=1 Tax=Actinomadura formosensis TaxID=60706 RepID=UPI0013F1672B|nr:tetratricopeptide repeat protein [Actinomadura formosensis]
MLHEVLERNRTGDDERTALARVYALIGSPGIGKTALALHWAHQVRDRFPDGDLYMDLQGYGPVSSIAPLHALDAFLRALGIPADRVPETLEERASLYRSTLNGKRVLVFIDNASSSKQVRPLLPASPDCFTVVTSRSTLPGLVAREGALRVTLGFLSSEESVELLSQIVGRSRVEPELSAAFQIAELCGHLPLALRIVGERISARPHISLPEVVGELVNEQNRLDALASLEDELSDTRTAFSWSYRALTPELRQSFRRIGLHAGPDIGPGAAAALIGTTVVTAKRRLHTLTGVHLLQEVQPNRFHMHDLLKSYVLELAQEEDTREERTQTVRRGLTWYLLSTDARRRAALPHSAMVPLVPDDDIEVAEKVGSSADATRWFAEERANIVAALNQSIEYGQFDITWKLATVASGLLELQSYWTDWEEGMRLGLRAARTIGDTYGEAVCNLILADAVWRAGRPDEAATHYQVTASMADVISAGWMRGFALRGLGLLREERADFISAQEYFQQALRVFRAAGPRRGEGMSLLSLGKCARALHDLPRSIELLEQAALIFEVIDDQWTLAYGKLPLATSLLEAGRTEEAISHLRQAAESFAAFRDRRSEALALESLAEALHQADRTAEALNCRRRAAELYEALANPRHTEIERRLEDLT